MEIAFQLTRNTYNKKTLSWNTKLRHYQTVVRPEALYAAETLKITRTGALEKLEKIERRFIRKILGPKNNQEGEYRLRSNKELYLKVEKITDVMRKRRLQFYGHIYRMDDNRLTKQIFTLINSYKVKPIWFREVDKDMGEVGFDVGNLRDRTLFRETIQNAGFQERERRTNGRPWTQERKEEHSRRMKVVWAQRKSTTGRRRPS